MTIYDWKDLPRDEQLKYRWICFDWKERQAVGFFKEATQADAMTKRGNTRCAPVDWGGLPRYQTIEEEDDLSTNPTRRERPGDTMSTYTPGPWMVRHRQHGCIYIGSERSLVAITSMGVDGENEDEQVREADARLIAAAPELLEALKLCERALEIRDTEAEMHAAKEARRIIAKAEGRTL